MPLSPNIEQNQRTTENDDGVQFNMNLNVWNWTKRKNCQKTYIWLVLFSMFTIITMLTVMANQIYLLRRDFHVLQSEETSASVSNRSVDRGNSTLNRTDSTVLNNVPMLPMALRMSLNVASKKENSPCNATTCEIQNRTTRDMAIDDSRESSIRTETRTKRLQRDEGRGPQIATFVGAIPEQHVTNSAMIGPWIKKNNDGNQFDLTKFHLVEKNMAIEITTDGLYSISVQIFYFGEVTKYSYWILLHSEGMSNSRKLVKCATTATKIAAEVSCYTSVIMHMRKGDRVHIEQQERDRFINMREGYSYIQLVLLANDTQKKRST